jgi:hypothetical protein
VFHSLGLKADGTILAWGDNGCGQCNIPSPNTGFVGVGGGNHSLGIRNPQSSAVEGPVRHGASGTDMLRILSVTPNPIATSAEIFFEARGAGSVSVTVHDVSGRQVTTAALGSFELGRHGVSWEARDAAGLRIPSGVYFLRLRVAAGGSTAVRLLLIR